MVPGQRRPPCCWRVVRFEFPYMARQRILERRQGPDRMPVLQEAC